MQGIAHVEQRGTLEYPSCERVNINIRESFVPDLNTQRQPMETVAITGDVGTVPTWYIEQLYARQCLC